MQLLTVGRLVSKSFPNCLAYSEFLWHWKLAIYINTVLEKILLNHFRIIQWNLELEVLGFVSTQWTSLIKISTQILKYWGCSWRRWGNVWVNDSSTDWLQKVTWWREEEQQTHLLWWSCWRTGCLNGPESSLVSWTSACHCLQSWIRINKYEFHNDLKNRV